MRTTTPTIAAVTAALTLALTGCGGDGGPGPTAGERHTTTWVPLPREGGDASPSSTAGSTPSMGDATPPSTTAPSPTSTDTGKPFDAKEFTDRIEAAVEADPTVSIEVLLTADGTQNGRATGVQDLSKDSLEMQLDLGGQQLDYRLVDGHYYLAQGSKWIPVTEDSTNPVVQSALEQAQLLSMRKQLDAFVAGVEQAGDKGTEQIDGVRTRHYTATVDTTKAFKALGIRKDSGTPDTQIYDVWLDEDDLIRRMSFSQEGSTAVMSATDWGEPISITAPTGDQLVSQP